MHIHTHTANADAYGHNIVGRCKKKNERRERQPYNITNAITLVCQCILVRIFSTNALIWRVRVYSTKMRLTLNSPCHKLYGRIFLKGSNFLCIVCISFALASDFGAVWVQVMWNKKTLRKRMKDETEQKNIVLTLFCCVFDNFDYAVPFRTPNEHFWYKSFKFTSLFVSLNLTSCCDWNERFPIRICEIFSNKLYGILLELRSKQAQFSHENYF